MKTTNNIMLQVFLALIPALLVKTYFWGINTIFLLVVAILTATVTEIVVAKLRSKNLLAEVSNNSAAVTCMILVLSLPSGIPYYIMLICTLVAILIAKQIYGGMGQNIFNPAMVGVAVFLITYPQFITYWNIPSNELNYQVSNMLGAFTGTSAVDAYTQATPLTEIKTLMQMGNHANLNQDLANITQTNYYPWLVYALSFLAGGFYLWVRKIITLTLPLVSIVAFVGLSCLHYLITGYSQANPLYSLIYGSMIFGAFFIVTDPVTAPQYRTGRIIYAISIGCLAYIIRAFTNYNDGIAFAVLLSNILVPLLDKFFTPKEFGR
ncbi:RnfABCDGE type electron transport complex subunit D [Psittacicella hinzii]|nr:RnfABCDGE type electron transport complex subunit D [Psittacicella hinzii]